MDTRSSSLKCKRIDNLQDSNPEQQASVGMENVNNNSQKIQIRKGISTKARKGKVVASTSSNTTRLKKNKQSQ